MPYVRSFEDAQPPERYDSVPYTKVLFQEAPDSAGAPGAFTSRSTITLATGVAVPAASGGVTPTGNDANPAAPGLRDVTTSAATIASGGWYRLVWEDAAGSQDEGAPVRHTAAGSNTIDLCTVEQVRRHRQYASGETGHDTVIAELITRWSRWIMRTYRREFAPAVTAAQRTIQFQPSRNGQPLIVDVDPWELRAVTAVTVDAGLSTQQTLTATQWEPVWHDRNTGTYLAVEVRDVTTVAPRRLRTLRFTGDWGCATIPEDAAEACILAVIMTLQQQNMSFGSVLQPNSLGYGVNDPQALPPGIRGLLAPLAR